jgi:hypothetical protein
MIVLWGLRIRAVFVIRPAMLLNMFCSLWFEEFLRDGSSLLVIFFVGNSVDASVLKKMLMAVVSKLESAGLSVAAVVCDQEASHRSCLTAMNVSVSEPSFRSGGGNTVYVMHDPPHLIKNVRNNLLTYDFIVHGKTVSFKHIENLYELESKNVLRFVPKLTKGHIQLTNLKKNECQTCYSGFVSQCCQQFMVLHKTEANGDGG